VTAVHCCLITCEVDGCGISILSHEGETVIQARRKAKGNGWVFKGSVKLHDLCPGHTEEPLG
jgi:hypothetical protein